MEMKKVSSSNLSEIGYDEATKNLRVKFKSGQLYEYEGIKPEQYNSLLNSKSLGKHFNQNIKNNFPCKEVLQIVEEKKESKVTRIVSVTFYYIRKVDNINTNYGASNISLEVYIDVDENDQRRVVISELEKNTYPDWFRYMIPMFEDFDVAIKKFINVCGISGRAIWDGKEITSIKDTSSEEVQNEILEKENPAKERRKDYAKKAFGR